MGRVTIFVTPWAGLMATGRMLGRGRAAPGRCSTPPWGGSGRAGKRYLVPASGSQEDGQTAYQRAEQKATGPDAWQRPGSSRAVRCVALGGPGRVDRRHLVTAPGGQEDGQTAHQWAGLRATGRMLGRGRAAPGRCAAALWAALAARMGGHLVPVPGSQQDGQTAHQRAGLRATGWCWAMAG